MLQPIPGEMIPGHLARASTGTARLRKTCAEFESLFLNYIMKSTRSTVPGGDYFGDKHGGEIVRSMFDETLSRQMASGGGIGLGSILFEQLKGRIR